MSRAKPEAGPAAEFLQPLRKFAQRHAELDALVFWANPDFQPEPTEEMDAEEAPYYVEGLMPEGFWLEWRLMAVMGESKPDHFQIYVWEAGGAAPGQTQDWVVLASGRWSNPG